MSNLEHPRITEVGRLLAENDRLSEALDIAQAATKTTTVDALLANGRLREQRDRLREALTKIADISMSDHHPDNPIDIAIAALAKEAGK